MKRLLAITTIALCAVSTGALSAQLAPAGQNIFTCELKSINLDEGHTLMVGSWKGLQITNPNSPDNNSTIDCVGTFEGMPDKSFKVSGYCLHVDRDGDKWIDRWWNDSTMKKGRWEGTGVSGKWKDVRAVTGNFVYTDLSNESGCKGVSNWEVAR